MRYTAPWQWFKHSTYHCPICNNDSYGKPFCKECWNTAQDNYETILFSTKELKENNLRKYIYEQFDLFIHSNNALKEIFIKTPAKYTPKKAENIKHNFLQLVALGIFDYKTFESVRLFERAIEEIEAFNPFIKTIVETEIDTDTDDFRKKFQANHLCEDGHYVRSWQEQKIDDYLYCEKKLLHTYEKKFRLSPDEQQICKKAGKNYEFFYPDFYIPDYNLYLEYFGVNDEEYNH